MPDPGEENSEKQVDDPSRLLKDVRSGHSGFVFRRLMDGRSWRMIRHIGLRHARTKERHCGRP